MWIIIVSGIFAMAAFATASQRRAASLANLGYVSERWLAEYRADQPGDSV